MKGRCCSVVGALLLWRTIKANIEFVRTQRTRNDDFFFFKLQITKLWAANWVLPRWTEDHANETFNWLINYFPSARRHVYDRVKDLMNHPSYYSELPVTFLTNVRSGFLSGFRKFSGCSYGLACLTCAKARPRNIFQRYRRRNPRRATRRAQ